MYGKHFESMYEGSMYGAGVPVFAVWGYVIAHARKARVELNPRKLADTLGGDVSEIETAIEFLMKPDPNSRHKEHEGSRLIKEGEFQYFLPSWETYQAIRSADDRREYNRLKQQERRQKLKETETRIATPAFQKPAVESVRLAMVKAGLPESEGDRFWDYYESKGWLVGRVKMKDWMGAVRNWKRNFLERNGSAPQHEMTPQEKIKAAVQ